jgi:hypothetical protein
MRARFVMTALLLAAAPSLAEAQDQGLGEIIVTAQRTSSDYFSDEQPVVGLKRQADSAVQPITISSDSRDEGVRKREIYAMLAAAVQRASSAGVDLVTGDFELVPVTSSTFRDLVFAGGSRPDTSVVSLMVKAKLSGSTGGAQKRIDDFIRAVPPDGRSLMEKKGGLTLTIINPDQYRDEIVKLVAAEAKRYAGYFGAEYGVEVSGLNEQLAWSQVSNADVFLYIPYRFIIKPR